MRVDILKKSIHELIDQIEDVELLAAVYKIIRSSKHTDWWDEISEDEKKLINQGIQELENGESVPHEDVMKEVNQILKRA